ncbi:hypothetical protein M5D96_004649 [Drosophila gunungcola]|uniref:Uncharacterized protein n=1 Tax=Drosophila gunungcola TaxID=103775 RepID=A0A9P9YUU4_9MUSC|nr:hypothetical protein M5D96_004649 [Drosophila gunungcola]
MNTYDSLTGAQELDFELELELELELESMLVDGRLARSKTWGQTLFGRLELRGHKVPTKVDTLAGPQWKPMNNH